MRIALLYPPPWKIAAPGETPDTSSDGPPAGEEGRSFDSDYLTSPYGLLSLAAQAIRAGHDVEILNLSNLPWAEVERALGGLSAELYGLTCFTGNRRGVALVAERIRQLRPRAHIVVGGPHVTALPLETLEHFPAIDTVAIGEGEETFMELIARLEAGDSVEGMAGLAWRNGSGARLGPPRPRIRDLDSLAPLHEHFSCHVLLTSRGCPGRCTFCGSNAMWGPKLHFHSVEYVLDSLEQMLRRLPVKTFVIKDDTFTADRKRALAICRGILDRKLNFLWSCDTRADAVDEELLQAMRLAGCQRLSLGVESASPEILKNIRKNISPEQVLDATRMMQKFGFEVRYYMMAGNRGETPETFQRSLDFIAEAEPDMYAFCLLTAYPGTEEFEILKQKGRCTTESFFTEKFSGFATFADTPKKDALGMLQWLGAHQGAQELRRKSVAECEAVLERLPDLHAAHMDLGGAYFRDNKPAEAQRHIRRAIDLDYPAPELAHNYLACIAGMRGDLEAVKTHLARAMEGPPRSMIVQNMNALTTWLEQGGPAAGQPLRLSADHHFDHPLRLCQPVMPGPIGQEQAGATYAQAVADYGIAKTGLPGRGT